MTHTNAARAYKPKDQKKAERNFYYRKIHGTWAALRPDLKRGSEEYKEALYTFAEAELRVERIGSFTELSYKQLRAVADALEREQRQPALIEGATNSAANVVAFTPKPAAPKSETLTGTPQAPVEHFSSLGQRFAINRLFGYLKWSVEFREKFVRGRYRTEKIERLTTKEAHALIRILLNCAASRYWKDQGAKTVSKPMIAAAISKLKAQLGIDA